MVAGWCTWCKCDIAPEYSAVCRRTRLCVSHWFIVQLGKIAAKHWAHALNETKFRYSICPSPSSFGHTFIVRKLWINVKIYVNIYKLTVAHFETANLNNTHQIQISLAQKRITFHFSSFYFNGFGCRSAQQKYSFEMATIKLYVHLKKKTLFCCMAKIHSIRKREEKNPFRMIVRSFVSVREISCNEQMCRWPPECNWHFYLALTINSRPICFVKNAHTLCMLYLFFPCI